MNRCAVASLGGDDLMRPSPATDNPPDSVQFAVVPPTALDYSPDDWHPLRLAPGHDLDDRVIGADPLPRGETRVATRNQARSSCLVIGKRWATVCRGPGLVNWLPRLRSAATHDQKCDSGVLVGWWRRRGGTRNAPSIER